MHGVTMKTTINFKLHSSHSEGVNNCHTPTKQQIINETTVTMQSKVRHNFDSPNIGIAALIGLESGLHALTVLCRRCPEHHKYLMEI